MQIWSSYFRNIEEHVWLGQPLIFWLLFFLSLADTSSPAAKESRRSSIESQKVGGEFADFLKTLKNAPALEVSKLVRGFIERMQQNIDAPVEELSEMVQDFYQSLIDKMSTQAVFKGTCCFNILSVVKMSANIIFILVILYCF